MSYSTLVVAHPVHAQRVAATNDLRDDEYPHFHCRNLDVGILGQVFWREDSGKEGLDKCSRIELAHSQPTPGGSVTVHVLPRSLCERYARLSEAEIDELTARWSENVKHIRLPRSSEFNGRVMKEVARLARLALERNQVIMLRTSFRRP
jgi:hypothetical protein